MFTPLRPGLSLPFTTITPHNCTDQFAITPGSVSHQVNLAETNAFGEVQSWNPGALWNAGGQAHQTPAQNSHSTQTPRGPYANATETLTENSVEIQKMNEATELAESGFQGPLPLQENSKIDHLDPQAQTALAMVDVQLLKELATDHLNEMKESLVEQAQVIFKEETMVQSFINSCGAALGAQIQGLVTAAATTLGTSWGAGGATIGQFFGSSIGAGISGSIQTQVGAAASQFVFTKPQLSEDNVTKLLEGFRRGIFLGFANLLRSLISTNKPEAIQMFTEMVETLVNHPGAFREAIRQSVIDSILDLGATVGETSRGPTGDYNLAGKFDSQGMRHRITMVVLPRALGSAERATLAENMDGVLRHYEVEWVSEDGLVNYVTPAHRDDTKALHINPTKKRDIALIGAVNYLGSLEKAKFTLGLIHERIELDNDPIAKKHYEEFIQIGLDEINEQLFNDSKIDGRLVDLGVTLVGYQES